MNDLDTVKAEITRQQELGLEAYVVQWGATLSILAQATNQSVSDLAALNGVEDEDLILTGDVLIGILDKEVTSASNASASATPSNTQNNPSSNAEKEVDAPANNNEEAASNETEDESKLPVVGGNTKEELDEEPGESEDSNSVEKPSEDGVKPNTPNESALPPVVGDNTKEELDDESSEAGESNGGDETNEDGEKPNTPDESDDESNGDESEGEVESPDTEEPSESVEEPGSSDEELPDESNDEDETETPDESSEEPNDTEGETETPDESEDESTNEEEPNDSDETPTESEEPNETDESISDDNQEGSDDESNNDDEDEAEEDEVVVSEVIETLPVDFTTETSENTDLPKGETRVVQEGKKGVETITYEVTVVNGEETDRVEASRVVTTQPINEIIEIGTKVEYQEPTKTTTEHVYGETEIRNEVYDEVNVGEHGNLAMVGGAYQSGRLEFLEDTVKTYIDANGDTIEEITTNQRGYFSYTPNYYNDNTLEPGVNVTTVQGQEGYKEFGYTDIYKNGIYQTTTYYDNFTVKEATVGTVVRGTKEIVGSRSWTEFTPIYAGTITTNDPNIPASESYTVAGKDGYIAINYQSVDGRPAVEVSREVVDAVYHEVYNGTK